jgi:hypothetical protein
MMRTVFALIICMGLLSEASAQKLLSSWTSPEYTKSEYRKVAVLAKISDKEVRQLVEDNAVIALRDKGITAITSYLNFNDEDMATRESLIAKADQLQVDAVVVFSVQREGTTVTNSPTLSVGAGIPVRIGFMHVYLGGSMPIAGGPKLVEIAQLRTEFYNREKDIPHWNAVYEYKIKGNYEYIAKNWSGKVVNALIATKIL